MILSTTKGGGWGALINGWFSKDKVPTQLVDKKIARPLSKMMEDARSKIDLDGDFFGQLSDIGIDEEKILNSGDQALLSLVDRLGGVKQGAIDAQSAFNELGSVIIKVPQQTEKAATGFSKLGSNLKSILSGTLTSMAVSAAIGLAVKGIEVFWTEVINAEETAIQRGKQAAQTITDLKDEFDKKDTFVNDNLEKYLKLRESTTSTEYSGVQNVSLDTSSYEEFLSLNNQIAELFPSLVSTYDSNGNAILNLSANVDTATESFKQLIEQQRMMTEYEIGENLPAAATGAAIQIKQATEEMDKYNQRATDLQGIQDILDNATQKNYGFDQLDLSSFGISDDLMKFQESYNVDDATSYEYYHNIAKIFEESWRAAGVQLNDTVKSDQIFDKETGEFINQETYGLMLNILPDDSQVEKFKDEFQSRLTEYAETGLPEDMLESVIKSQQADSEIKATWNSLVPTLLSQMDLYDQYRNLGDSTPGKQLQQIIADDIANMDYMALSDTDKGKFKKETRAFLRERFLDPIVNAAKDEKGNLQEDVLKQITDTLSDTDSTRKEWQENVVRLSQDLFDTKEKQQEFRIAIGATYVTEDGKELFTGSDPVQQLQDMTGINWKDIVKTLGDDEIEFALSLKGDFDFEGTTAEELLEYIEKVREARKKAKEIEKDGTLSSIFNDENYQSDAEGYEKQLSSLTGALETIRTEGKLTAEQMRDLQEEFPDMTDFSKEAISDNAMKTLGEWIDKFKENIDTMTPEGLEQLHTYVENLTMSFGDLGVSAEEAMKAVYDSMIDPNASLGKQQGQSAQAKAMFDDLISQIEDEGGEVNYQVIWELAMMDRFSDPAADIYQEYNNRKLQWDIEMTEQNVADIQKGIDARASRKGVNEAARGYIEETGETLPNMNKDYFNRLTEEYNEARREYGEDSPEAQKAKKAMNAAYEEAGKSVEAENASFEETLKNDRADVEAKKNIWLERKSAYDSLGKEDTESKEYKDMQDAQAAYYQALTTEQQDIDAMDQYNLKDYNNAITRSQAEAAKAQNQIDELKNKGMRVSKEYYDALSQSYTDQAVEQENIASYWDTVAADTKRSVNDRVAAEKAAADARAEAISLRQQADETGRSYSTDQLTEYQNAYTDLQTKATKSQEEITKAETNHQKVSEKVYNDLIKNGNDQIKNMQDQQRTLRDLQKTVAYGSDTWRDYQSQIDSLDSSIASMKNEQVGWYESMTSIISSNAQTLASTLSSAFSEMNSETGLTIDTMNELKRQFSDLAGYDVSNIFYQSADGMKMNTYAAETLVEAEYKLQTNNLYEAIDQQRNIIELLGNSEDESAQKAVAAAEQRIDAYNRELSMLQALYAQQKDQFSNYQKWQNAQQTENAGARYENLQGYMETATKAYDQGMTGTDDFRSYVQYFDKWGLDTVESYERNIEKMKRYLTDDYTGVKNFYDDLIKNGFGTEENGIYDIEMTNVEEAAKTMGMSSEWLKDMMSRGEDYGFTNDWVESELDGRMKLQDLMQKQIDAQKKVNELEREGAPQEVIKEAQDVLDTYQNSAKNVAENIQDVIANDGKISATQIQGAVENINSYREMLKDVQQQYGLGNIDAETATGQIQLIHDNIEAEAAQWHIPLDGFEVDTDALNKQFEGWDTEVSVTPKWENIEGIDDSTIGQSFYDTSEKIKTGWDENQTSLQENISSLQKLGLTYEELKGINLDDHKYDDEDNASLIAAEQALDNIKTTLGLNVEEATQLVEVLQQLGLLEAPDLDFNIPTSVEDLSKQNRAAYAEELPIEIQQELAKQAAYRENADMYAPISDSITGASEEIVSAIGTGAETISSSIDKNETGESQDIKQTENISGAGLDSSDVTVHGQMIADQQYAQSNVETNQSGVIVNLDNQAFNAQIEAAMQKIDDLNNKSANPTVNLDGQAFIAQIDAANQKLDELNSKQINPTANIDGSQFVNQANAASDKLNSLAGNSVSTSINLDGSSFVKSANAAQDKLDSLGGATASPTLDANNASLVSKTDDARARITALDGMSANPSVNVTGNASSMISSIESSLNSLNGREVVTRIVTEHVDRKGSGLGGINNNVALAGGNAFARGKDNSEEVSFNYNGGTLVGEEAPEMHVSRDGGYWQLVGQNGPEFRDDIAPGDIIFNAEQTRKLLKNGHVNSRGRALAGGTQTLSGFAFAGSTDSTNKTRWNKVGNNTLGGNTKSTEANTKATNANTGAKDKETAATENTVTALDKFNAWLSSLFDWIEVRIERITHRMELAISKAENIGGSQTYQGKRKEYVGQVGYIGKNAYISDAMDENKKLQRTNTRAVPIYEAQATKVAKRAQKAGLITKKQRKNLVKKIKNGAMSIEEFDAELKKNKKGEETSKSESTRKTFVDAYKQW